MLTSQIVVYRWYKSSVKWPLVSGSGTYQVYLLIAITGKNSYLTINIHSNNEVCFQKLLLNRDLTSIGGNDDYFLARKKKIFTAMGYLMMSIMVYLRTFD